MVVAGTELLTGNMRLPPMALLRTRIVASRLVTDWGLVLVGNLVGALVVAYFAADQTGVIGSASSVAGSPGASTFTRLASITIGKAITESGYQVFLRAIGCSWMDCLGVWMAVSARDIAGKILAIVFPVRAFVALGFDHVVTNFFFLPLSMMQHVPGVTFAHVLSILVFALLGNIVGAALFVAGAYWFRYLKNRPAGAVTATAHSAQAQSARR